MSSPRRGRDRDRERFDRDFDDSGDSRAIQMGKGKEKGSGSGSNRNDRKPDNSSDRDHRNNRNHRDNSEERDIPKGRGRDRDRESNNRDNNNNNYYQNQRDRDRRRGKRELDEDEESNLIHDRPRGNRRDRGNRDFPNRNEGEAGSEGEGEDPERGARGRGRAAAGGGGGGDDDDRGSPGDKEKGKIGGPLVPIPQNHNPINEDFTPSVNDPEPNDGDGKKKYEVLGAGSGELIHVGWSVLKVILYFIMLGWAGSLYAGDPNARPCATAPGFTFCLLSNYSFQCTTTSNTLCSKLCLNGPHQFDPQTKIGCQLALDGNGQPISPAQGTCYGPNDFPNVCNDVLSCYPAFITSTQNSLLFYSIVLIIMILLEFFTVASFMNFNSTHPDEFKEFSKADYCLLFMAKLGGTAKQFICVFVFLTFLFMIYTFVQYEPKCRQALNNDKSGLTLFKDVEKVVILSGILLISIMTIGSCIRMNVSLRGELVSPSNDSELECPAGLDCPDLRNRPNPKCCPEFWAEQIDDGPNRVLAKQISKQIDFFFATPTEYIGNCCEVCYRERHFLGP